MYLLRSSVDDQTKGGNDVKRSPLRERLRAASFAILCRTESGRSRQGSKIRAADWYSTN
jgi:hypothetical protein